MAEMMEGLNLVLLGRTGIGKSASGNTILGREAFMSKKSSTSVTRDVSVESGTVHGRWVTVYDTPGLFNTDMTEREIQQKYEYVLQRCESGPCVFLLVIKADRFTGKERKTVEKIEELLGEERLKKTWILFTSGDQLEDENVTIDEFIDLSEPLKRLVQKYDQRYHVFNNKKRGPTEQGRTLLVKVIQRSSWLKGPFMEMSDMTAGLSLVLLGKARAGISASGNTILGRQAFISKKSSKSVTRDVAVESGDVGGITITVYDTPGLFNTELKDDEIQLIYEKVLQRCESGPCVFLLVIKPDRFTEEERETVEKIEELLGGERLEKTWILFTRGDELEEDNMTIKELINETEPLKNLIQKYDQRYHVFNNKKKGPTEQVQELLIKILKTYIDTQVGEEMLNPLKRKTPKDTEPAAPVSRLSSRRIVLLGKIGVGKSAAGNTILGQKEFTSVMGMSSVTSVCSDAHATVSGRSVSVVDTPGLFDTKMKPDQFVTEMARSVYISSPGPHAFLIVFPVNNRFTECDQQIPQIIEMMFGQEVLKYSIILFTHGDQLDGESVEKLIEENSRLRDLVDQCGGRFHVFNNRDQNNREQVNDLLQKIDTMIEQNGGHYSYQMFEDAQRFRREEEEQRQREEEQRKQEEKRIQEKIERVSKEVERERRIREEKETRSFFTKYKKYFVTAAAVTGAIAAAPVVVGAVAVGAVGAVAGVAGAAAGAAVGAAVGAVAGAGAGAQIVDGMAARADGTQRRQRKEEERKQKEKK